MLHYNTVAIIFQYLYVFLHKIHKYISTNIKTSLSTAALAFDSIKNLGADLNPATLAAYNAQLSGLTVTQQKMALSTTSLTSAQQKQVLAYIAETAAAKSLTAQQIAELSIDQKQALIKAGLIAQEQIEAGVTLELSKAQLQKIITSDAISTKDKQLILSAFGVTGANLTEASSWKVLGASIKTATIEMMKWLFLTPAGWATLAIAGVVGLIGAYAKWGPTLENTRKKLENLKSECETLASDLSSVNSELETTKQRINELEGKESLTFVEAEELENLKKQNNELERTIDLLELEQKTKNKEKNKTFVDTMEKDVYSTDYYKDGLDGGKIKKGQAGRSEHRTTTTEQAYIIQQFNDREKLLDDLTNAETEAERKRIQEQIDKIDKYLSDRNDQFKSDAEGIDYIQNPTTEDDKKVNEWLDYINDFQDKMAIAMGGDNAKENAFNRLVDNWKFDEALNPLQKLGKEGKVTLDDLKSRMSDPVFAEFVNKLVKIGVISNTTDGSLRYLANAFNGTATSARNYVTALKGNDLNNFIKNLDEEAKALGTTKSELAKLTAAHVIFNNTGLSTEQQQAALRALAKAITNTQEEMKYLLQLFNYASGNFDVAGASTMTEQERRARTVRSKQYLKDKYGIDLSTIKIPEKEEIENPYNPTDDDKGKDNTPDYEDPTDAIINRINLRAKELEQQEESIQNAIEIAELENDYKKQISLTNDLIAARKKRVEELNKANDGLHNEAEYLRNSNPWDEESWFDSQGNATKAYTDLLNDRKLVPTKEIQEQIKNLFEKLSKYKKAYAENTEEITELNKEILQDEKEILDLRTEQFEKANDFANTYLDSKKTLLQAHYDIENSITEARHELNKELETSMTMYAYLDEETRKLLFNQEDYNKLTQELNTIEDESLRLQSEYENKLRNATLETVESITSEYQMQYETLMKSYNIAKADLDIAKKKQQLNNVLNERNVKMLIDGKWQWVANADEVAKAKSELADAEYAKRVEEAGLTQQQSIDNLTRQQDALGVVVKQFENGVIDLDSAIRLATKAIGSMPSALASMFSGAKTFSSSSSYVGISSSGGKNSDLSSVYKSNDYAAGINSALARGDVDAALVANKLRNDKIDYLGLDTEKWSDDDIKKRAKKHATGTKYTPGGLTLMGEEGFEAYIDKSGNLIPINQPTIGNIDSGGVVFNAEQMKNLRNLWDLSNLSRINSNSAIVNRTAQGGNNGTQNNFAGDIIINSPRDYNDFVKQLTQRIKTKSI